MSGVMKIVVIDQQKDMTIRIEQALLEFHIEEYEVLSYPRWEDQSFEGIDCIIIDHQLVKDIKRFMDMVKALSVPKVIVVTDSLNQSISPVALMLGASVYYRQSPIASLVYKIYDSYKPNRELTKLRSFEEIKSELGSKLIAVHSPKGGVGKTTISINLAIQFARRGLKVLLLDCSLYGNVGINLKINHRGTGFSSILAALEHENQENLTPNKIIKENIYSYVSGNQSVAFDVLISASPLKMEKVTSKNVEMILSATRKLEYDVVIVDTSSELCVRNLAIFEMVDEIIMVAAPDITSGWNLIQLKEILDHIGVSKKCKLMVNLYSKYVGFSCRELEMELQYPLIGILPYETEVQLLHNQGIAVGFKEKHKINILIKRVAHNIIPIFKPKELKVFNPINIFNTGILFKKNKNTSKEKVSS